MRLAPTLISAVKLAAAVGLGAVVAASVTAPTASAAPAIAVAQDCTPEVEPGGRIEVTARVTNPGDVPFVRVVVEGDAGTPETTADDFQLAFQSGDTNGNSRLDPGETWIFRGSYTGRQEFETNVVGADGFDAQGNLVSALAPCSTDVVAQPRPAERVEARPVRGTVLVRLPGTARFVELRDARALPVGTQVDTLRGTIRLTSAIGGGRTNTSDFFDGLFTFFQRRAGGFFTELRLDGGNFRLCPNLRRSRGTSAAEARKRPSRRLWGRGKGRFRTRGRYSSATIRGTTWLTLDTCAGTLTRVTVGSVTVRDFVRRRTIVLRAGQSYLARPPRRG